MIFQGYKYADITLPCNRENMTKLAEALESGKFEQGQGYLLSIEDGKRKHCCLGVACELSGLGEWSETDHNGAWNHPAYAADGFSSSAMLPTPVMEWLGIDAEAMRLTDGNATGDALYASELNDANEDEGGPFDFKAIAAKIRQVYLS